MSDKNYIVTMEREFHILGIFGEALGYTPPYKIQTFDLFNLTSNDLKYICNFINKYKYDALFRLLQLNGVLIVRFNANRRIYKQLNKELSDRYFDVNLNMCFKDNSKYLDQNLLYTQNIKRINPHNCPLSVNDYCYYSFDCVLVII